MSGSPPRICVYQVGRNRCAADTSASGSPGWHSAEMTVTPSAGARSLRADPLRGRRQSKQDGDRVSRDPRRAGGLVRRTRRGAPPRASGRFLPSASRRTEFRVRVADARRPFLLAVGEDLCARMARRVEGASKVARPRPRARERLRQRLASCRGEAPYELTVTYASRATRAPGGADRPSPDPARRSSVAGLGRAATPEAFGVGRKSFERLVADLRPPCVDVHGCTESGARSSCPPCPGAPSHRSSREYRVDPERR